MDAIGLFILSVLYLLAIFTFRAGNLSALITIIAIVVIISIYTTYQVYLKITIGD